MEKSRRSFKSEEQDDHLAADGEKTVIVKLRIVFVSLKIIKGTDKMFFFFDEQNSRVSNMAFETFILSVLRIYLESQGKTIQIGTNVDFFDAFLPDGIDNLPGPILLEIKQSSSNKSSCIQSVKNYADSIKKYSDRIKDYKACSILIILGVELSENDKNTLEKMASARSERQVFVWGMEEFNSRTADYQKDYKDYIERPTKTIVEEVINKPTTEEQLAYSKKALIAGLKKKYDNEDIALFIGAGVSSDAGIPNWNDLIDSLLSEMILHRAKDEADAILSKYLNEIVKLANKNKENSPLMQMRYIRGAFNTSEYHQLVYNALYKGHPRSNTHLLDVLAEICTPRRNHIGVQGIVTYNFDDLLERRLKQQKVSINIISDEDDITEPDKLSVFHVHGFLPYENFDPSSDFTLVFSEEDYHQVYRDAYCWSNLTQLNYLRDRTCLFIGCSLRDPNLRRLLDIATRNNEKPRHYAFLRRNSHFVDDVINPDALKAYENIDLQLREKYFATMGVNIIWIDEFEEIPKILKSLLT